MAKMFNLVYSITTWDTLMIVDFQNLKSMSLQKIKTLEGMPNTIYPKIVTAWHSDLLVKILLMG